MHVTAVQPSTELAVVILAGGVGRRIGGDKPLKTFHGIRLVDHALSQARQWSDLIAVAVREPAQVQPMENVLIEDAPVPGPLGGLTAGLQFALDNDRTFLLSMPIDMPFLPPDLLDRLAANIGDRGCALAASGGQLHPVCGLWRTASLGAITAYVAAGRRSLKGLAEQIGFASVDWPAGATDPFFNINTKQDLAEAAQAQRCLSRGTWPASEQGR